MRRLAILLAVAGMATLAALPAAARPARADRVETWSCDGSPGPFQMRFSNFRRGPRGTTIAYVAYPGGGGLEATRVTIRGLVWRVGQYYDFRRSRDGRHMNWVSRNTGDPIDCRRQG